MPENVVIIGSGPAAWTAAIYAARANLTPLVFQGNPFDNENKANGTMPLGQLALTTEVENFPSWPAGDTRAYLKTALAADDPDFPYWVSNDDPQPTHGINGPELVALMRQQAKNVGTQIESKDITKVDFSKKPFTLTAHDGQVVETHTVIVATGARANYLGLPSEDRFKNKGVSACAVCDGALPRFRNKWIVVVGGGDSACEEATYLSKFGHKVFMVLRRDVLRASRIMADRVTKNPKIVIFGQTSVKEVHGTDSQGVTGIELTSVPRVRLTSGQWTSFSQWFLGEDEAGVLTPDVSAAFRPWLYEEIDGKPTSKLIPSSGLFLAIGHTPNVGFLGGQLELNEKGYVKWTTLSRTYTSVEGVFAAGDVADDYYRQAISAAGTGCMAALDAERYLGHHGLV